MQCVNASRLSIIQAFMFGNKFLSSRPNYFKFFQSFFGLSMFFTRFLLKMQLYLLVINWSFWHHFLFLSKFSCILAVQSGVFKNILKRLSSYLIIKPALRSTIIVSRFHRSKIISNCYDPLDEVFVSFINFVKFFIMQKK